MFTLSVDMQSVDVSLHTTSKEVTLQTFSLNSFATER